MQLWLLVTSSMSADTVYVYIMHAYTGVWLQGWTWEMMALMGEASATSRASLQTVCSPWP